MPRKIDTTLTVKDRGTKTIEKFSSRTKKNLGEVQRKAKRVTDTMGKGFQKTTQFINNHKVALLAAAGTMAYLVKRNLSMLDSIGKTADKLGITTDALQEYRFAAEQTGVKQTALDMGLQRFTRRLAEAREGTGEMKKIIEKYNISLENADGTNRSATAVMGDLAEVIKNTEDPTEQLRIAFKAFDSEGVAMVNMLRDGREGLEAFREQAQRLGIVVDENIIRQAEKANDKLNIMSKQISARLSIAVSKITPMILNMADAFVYLTDRVEDWTTFSADEQMFALAKGVAKSKSEIVRLKAEIAEAKTGERSITQTLFGQSVEQMEEELNRHQRKLKEAQQKLSEMNQEKIRKQRETDRDTTGEGIDLPGLGSTDGAEQEGESRREHYERMRQQLFGHHDRVLANTNMFTQQMVNAELERMNTTEEAQDQHNEKMISKQEELAGGFADMATDLISGNKSITQSFGQMAKSIIEDLTKVMLKRLALKAIGGMGGGFGGFFGSLFGAAEGGVLPGNFMPIHAFAKGGMVDRPTLGMVGEKGPEVVMPLDKLDKMGGTTIITKVNVNMKGGEEGGGQRGARTMGDRISKMVSNSVKMEIQKQKRPGGVLNTAGGIR